MQVIERWMLQVSQHGGIERFDDLHIDDIDPQWKNRNLWAEASGLAFRSAVEVRNRLSLPFTVGLGMSLRPDAVVTNDVGLAELISRVDWTPPSLYLFRQGKEPGHDLKSDISSGSLAADSVSLAFRAIDIPAAKSGVLLRFRRRDSDDYTTSAFLFG